MTAKSIAKNRLYDAITADVGVCHLKERPTHYVTVFVVNFVYFVLFVFQN